MRNRCIYKLLFVFTLMLFFNFGYGNSHKKSYDSTGEKIEIQSSDDILAFMSRVADWQLQQMPNKFHDLDWTNATFYIGLSRFAEIAKDEKYYLWLKDLGNKYKWQPFYGMYIADDIAVSQMYLDIYRKEGKPEILNPTLARTEWVLNHPSRANLKWGQGPNSYDRWSWCDALFMAPPVYAKMYSITRDTRFLDFMHEEFMITYNLLYDHQENLFFRDYRFLDQKEKNGEKVFWGRGNGWVVAGLVSILKELPENNIYHDFYQTLFIEMCERITGLQDENGYWHASLLDTKSFPNPETSTSSFFVYALAYGINTGLLSEKDYLPLVEKGWQALGKAVSPDGKLGWVQPVGAFPENVSYDMTEVYGVGALLLAGSEIYLMHNKKSK